VWERRKIKRRLKLFPSVFNDRREQEANVLVFKGGRVKSSPLLGRAEHNLKQGGTTAGTLRILRWKFGEIKDGEGKEKNSRLATL